MHAEAPGAAREALARLDPARTFERPEAVEAFAARAELDADFAGPIERFEAQLAIGALDDRAQLWLGRLYACSQSHARASAALAVAESATLDERERAILELSRGMLATSRRDWRDALREFRSARARFTASDDAIGQLVCATHIGHTLSAMGLLIEAHDELVAASALVAERGLAAAKWTATLAALLAHRGELDEARARLDALMASGEPIDALTVIGLIHTTRAELFAWSEDYGAASRELQALRERSARAGSRVFEGFAMYTQAVLEFDAGRLDESLRLGRETTEVGRAIDVQTLVDGGALVRATALAALGRRTEALVEFRSVRPPFNVDVQPSFGVGQLAIIELLLSEGAASDDEREPWTARARGRAALLCKRDENGLPFCEGTLTNRLLWRRLHRAAARAGIELTPASIARASCVSPDGTSVLLPANELLSLGHRPVLARVLAALAAEPHRTRSIEALASAAWPEDRSSAASMKARVRVAIATLRQLGLGDAIETVANGYKLNCDVGAVSSAQK